MLAGDRYGNDGALTMDRRGFLRSSLAGLLFLSSPYLGEAATRTYRIQKGDTLNKIARLHGVTVSELKRLNGLRSDAIQAGRELKIPVTTLGSVAEVAALTRKLSIPLAPWSMVVGHHSAIEQGNAAIYHRGHLQRGMKNGLAYHFVIGNGIDSGDGEIEIGPRWINQQAGGHVRSAAVNARGIGICLVGNFEKRKPSARQVESLVALIGYLKKEVIKGDFTFAVHREIDPGHTVCPGRLFPVESLRKRLG